MNTQANKFLRLPPLLLGGIAAILVSGIAIGSLAVSTQGANGAVAPAVTAEAAAAPSARASRCAGCGVIESTRKVEAPDGKSWFSASDRIGSGGELAGKPSQVYEITVRLRDGSRRVITDAHPARWRQGEPVTLIAGIE